MQNRKNDIRFHEDMKLSSISVYGQKPMPSGYSMLKAPIENKSNGFYAQVWRQGNDIVIVYRGTNDLLDANNDRAMVRGKIPAQTTDALALHDRIKREYPNCTITLTGHSLGGSLAQIVSAIRGTFAVTFNAYGTRNMFKDPENLKEDNIVNYIDEYDPLAMQNAENNVGVTYSVTGQRKAVIGNHFIDDMPPLETRVLKSKAGLLYAKEILHKKLAKAHDYIRDNKQNNNYGLAHFVMSKCAGAYDVSGYTRADGIKVDGYIRRCGAKHLK